MSNEKILIDALSKINAGTIDDFPPYRGINLSIAQDIAYKALDNYKKEQPQDTPDPICNCHEWKDLTAGVCPVHGCVNTHNG